MWSRERSALRSGSRILACPSSGAIDPDRKPCAAGADEAAEASAVDVLVMNLPD